METLTGLQCQSAQSAVMSTPESSLSILYSAAAYGRFLDTCARHGIDVPIIPGLMPLDGWARLRSFARANGTRIPDWLERLFAQGEETPELVPYLAATATLEQARRLIAYGAPSLHIYCMNRWPLPLALARLLGHR